MVFNNGTESLLKKLNIVPTLTWELSDVGIRFNASYMQVVAALFESTKQLNSVGIVTAKDFLEFVGENTSYRLMLEVQNNDSESYLESIGWIDECFDGYGAPVLDPVIDVVSESSSNGQREIIFTITFYKAPCSGCLDCLKDFNNVCDT